MGKQVRHLSSPGWRSRDIKLGQRRKRQCLAAKKTRQEPVEKGFAVIFWHRLDVPQGVFLLKKTPGSLLITRVCVRKCGFFSMDGSGMQNPRMLARREFEQNFCFTPLDPGTGLARQQKECFLSLRSLKQLHPLGWSRTGVHLKHPKKTNTTWCMQVFGLNNILHPCLYWDVWSLVTRCFPTFLSDWKSVFQDLPSVFFLTRLSLTMFQPDIPR